MKRLRSAFYAFTLAATAVAISACGGGSTAVPAAVLATVPATSPATTPTPVTPVTPAAPTTTPPTSATTASSNSFVITNATVASRNGTYTPSSSLGQLTPAQAGVIDYNGNTVDGKFEWDVQYTIAGVIKSSYVWYYEAGNNIVFFGCNGGSIPCTGVSYNAATKQINYTNVVFAQINYPFPGPAVLAPAAGAITVNGSVNVQ